ncbi:hypothetical protein NA57DRAFT_51345 [Rhizodiscina lignyota]|uniref:J domain-containing protein n=1 Tax=Rhizodiscina lignyota TaxID=1504668 RepID=A0A9P4IRL7_9PEZI|nr:hypothetical protein NA57DRAFT_51345 [Rhizodiscina lignyota]
MSTDYNYDEQGQFFPYFVLVITSLVTLPTTWSVLKPSKELENTAPRIQSDFKPKDADLIEGQRRKQKRRERKLKRMLFALGGWLVMAYMVYLIIVTAATIPKIWDPYEVLGISMSADEKSIKSHYRKLSLTKHPDKVRIDPAKNETAESVNEAWVEISKAFKALTDEEVRNNYLQYGHPDGKQSFSIGIALPKIIVTEGNGKYVLVLYAIAFGILLPWLVGSWWYGTQKMTKDKVLIASAGKLFQEYDGNIDEGGVIAALSTGDEFKDMLKGAEAERGMASIEKRVLSETEGALSVREMTLKDRDKLRDLDEGVRRKVLGLLWAYLSRTDLDDQKLNDEKFEVAPIALGLVESFTSISLAFMNVQPLLAAYRTSQKLIQATLPNASPLLQLPHFTPKVVSAIEGENSRTHLTIQGFMGLPADERKKLATGPGLLTESQYSEATKIAKQLPVLKIEKAFFKVQGEKCIIPNSLVQFVVKARIIPPGTVPPPVVEKDLEDKDEAEEDSPINAEKKEQERIQPPVAHAPYFARDHSPRWYIFLADAKQGKIAVPPFTFSTFDKPLFDDNGKPTFNVQTLRMQFGAPPGPGRYTFSMNVVCDSYVGTDIRMDVVMVVEEASKAEEMESEEDISEPDEDSIAGQMQALKTGGAPPKKKKAPAPKDDSDDDESDTEGDAESESETDTETDSDSE